MVSSDPNRQLTWAWVVIVAMTLVRLVYAQSFLLVPDETNYWQWSRHLAWGYHDQTPMIGWAIYLTTQLFGHTELAVRLPSILSMTIACIYLALITRRWFSPIVVLQTVLLAQSILIFNVGAVLATADGLLGAGWAAASYHTARGFEENHWRQWLLGGAWFGFGLLSKYTMVLFLPFVFLFGLVTPLGRRRMVAVRPYLGCAVGLVMFSPVIAWNAANNWNSIRHVAYLGGANEPASLHLRFLGDYLASQAAVLTPLVFVMMCAAWIWVLRRWKQAPHWIHAYLFLTSFPIVAGFALLSLRTRIYGNWPCFGYLTATVLTAAIWSYGQSTPGRDFKKTRVLWRWCLGSSYAITILVFVHVIWPILPIPVGMDRTLEETTGWRHLGQTVGEARSSMPRVDQTFIFGLNYQTASELAFYVPGNPYTVSVNRWNRPNVYDYWWNDEDLHGMDAIGLMRSGRSRKRLHQIFERVDPPSKVEVYASSPLGGRKESRELVRKWYLYRCYGFKGGLRWIPKKESDVRGG